MKSNKVKIDQALKELEAAFAQPEVIKAVKELIGVMPPLVHGFAELLKVVEKLIGGAANHVTAPAAKAAAEMQTQVAAGKKPATAADVQAHLDQAPWFMKAFAKLTGFDPAKAVPVAPMPATGIKAVENAGKAIAAAPTQQQAVENASRAIEQSVHPPASPPGQAGGMTPMDAPQARQVKAVEKAADVHEVLTRNVLKASSALERLANSAGTSPGGTTGGAPTKGPGGTTPVSPGWADKYGG
jgi:hypothetical protein